MLADHPIHAALPAADLERARRFYAEKFGLTPQSEGNLLVLLQFV